jgi:hypothetical protein
MNFKLLNKSSWHLENEQTFNVEYLKMYTNLYFYGKILNNTFEKAYDGNKKLSFNLTLSNLNITITFDKQYEFCMSILQYMIFDKINNNNNISISDLLASIEFVNDKSLNAAINSLLFVKIITINEETKTLMINKSFTSDESFIDLILVNDLIVKNFIDTNKNNQEAQDDEEDYDEEENGEQNESDGEHDESAEEQTESDHEVVNQDQEVVNQDEEEKVIEVIEYIEVEEGDELD